MPVPIFPISDHFIPLKHGLTIDVVINKFGDAYEQRIVKSIPRGPRSDGEGDQSTYPGVNNFSIVFNHLLFRSQPVTGNANLDNSVEALWAFYKARFYDSSTQQIKYEAFYVYNLDENDDLTTWTGDTPSSGTNSRGESVDNDTGKYLVRFPPNLSKGRFAWCLWRSSLELPEVAE